MELNKLPEDCICKILSFTSPIDVCRSSCVSTLFQSAAESDFLWEKLLPSNYVEILSSSKINPPNFSSKKELFLHLCNPIFIDDGRKSFKIEKSCGKKSYMLSAKDLQISWSDEPMYWSWLPLPQSRFPEVAMLKTICWVEIEGKIKSETLSRNTLYGAYLVMKISDTAYGLDLIPSEVSIEVGNQLCSSNIAYLCNGSKHSTQQKMQQLLYANRMQMLQSRVTNNGGEVRIPSERDDGWMEIELGDFYVNGESQLVKMKLKEVKGQHLKGGLVIEGIEVRPKHSLGG